MSRSADVLIVGAGPSGLAAAIELRRLGIPQVSVLDREANAGGIPRHSDHLGYGLRDLHVATTGPRYAAKYVRRAERAGVEILTETSATGWAGPTTLATTSPRGVEAIEAGAVILATGCRERPRSARLVPGSRPQGILTTGALQQFVHLQHRRVGWRAVIVGAEHVSFSAALTLAHAGARVVAMVTEHEVDQTSPLLRAATAGWRRIPVRTGQRVTNILGRGRVEAVEVTDVATGALHRIACDTVVFSGDWIPDHELARLGSLEMDPDTRGPRVDEAQRTSSRGVFASGNLLHAAETADTAALCGREVANSAASFLRTGQWPETPPVPLVCEDPVAWISPSAILDPRGHVPHGHFIARVRQVLRRPELQIRQDGRVLWSRRFERLRPGIGVHIPGSVAAAVDARGGPVRISALS